MPPLHSESPQMRRKRWPKQSNCWRKCPMRVMHPRSIQRAPALVGCVLCNEGMRQATKSPLTLSGKEREPTSCLLLMLPLRNLQVALTQRLRANKLPPKHASLHVLCKTPDGTFMPLEHTNVPPPTIRGPTFNSMRQMLGEKAEPAEGAEAKKARLQ